MRVQFEPPRACTQLFFCGVTCPYMCVVVVVVVVVVAAAAV